MASAVRASWNWVKMVWGTQPVLFLATVMGVAGRKDEGCTVNGTETAWRRVPQKQLSITVLSMCLVQKILRSHD